MERIHRVESTNFNSSLFRRLQIEKDATTLEMMMNEIQFKIKWNLIDVTADDVKREKWDVESLISLCDKQNGLQAIHSNKVKR